MARDLAVAGSDDRPNFAAEVGEALGAAGVNIEGLCGTSSGEVHLLVEDVAAARAALERAGLEVRRERDVLIRNMAVVDRPGAWGRLARRLTAAGVGIEFFYLASGTRIVVGVDDYTAAVAAVQVMGG